jgi:putative addiction module antidote
MNKPATFPNSVKLVAIGNSTGMVIPREMLARLGVSQGDQLYVSESPDGLRLTATDPAFVEKMRLAEEIMREDREILAVLAK